MRRYWLLLLAVLTLGACAPVADTLVEVIERSDGATLTYVLASEPGGPGIAFDPDGREAVGVIVRAEADALTLLSVPDGATCEVTTTTLDCRLGDVGEAVLVGVTGQNVVANATWRRPAASTVYLTFATLPEGD